MAVPTSLLAVVRSILIFQLNAPQFRPWVRPAENKRHRGIFQSWRYVQRSVTGV